ncbi:MAG: CRISPR-associated RecB family exonuclease Cas4 [Anaerolineae bacterium]|jgi:CRISPR-associated exonuclease Cas4|nr:MAG: CRISPR-associated RecB family exonuclease Cas4 [Anaerolineae bacterium]
MEANLNEEQIDEARLDWRLWMDPIYPLRVTDLKQWFYCRRIVYYAFCLPDVRPLTFKMLYGRQAGEEEILREMRRSTRRYGIPNGRREFEVELASERLGLRGKADLVIWVEEEPAEVVVVEYKNSSKVGQAVHYQLLAYAAMLEEKSGLPARRGFVYLIPLRRTQEITFTENLRQNFYTTLQEMHQMIHSEKMPPPAPERAKCLSCEFRRFCNDV